MTATMDRPAPAAPAPAPAVTTRASRWRQQFTPARIIALVVMFVLVVYPLGWVVTAAFIKQGAPLPNINTDWGLTLKHLGEAIYGHASVAALRNSLFISLVATALSTVAGVMLAWVAARTDVPFPRVAAFSGIVPLLVPGLVGAIGWAMLGAPKTGYISLFLEWIHLDFGFSVYTMAGIIFIYAVYHTPLVFVFTYGALRLTNPDMEDAAAVHGATKWGALRMVTVPLVKPAILSAVLLNFVAIVEDFPVAMILGYSNGIPTVAARLFVTTGQAPAPYNANAAQAILLMVVIMVLVTYQRRLIKGQNYATVSGKGVRQRKVELGPVGRWVAFLAVIGYIMTSVGLPFLALLMGSIRPTLFTRSFPDLFDPQFLTLEPLKKAVLDEQMWRVATNSIYISVSVAVIGVLLAVLVAYAARDQTKWTARLLGRIAMLPAAIPGVVLGLSLLWAYVLWPITIYGTVIIMIVATMGRLTPISHSAVSATMGSIHPDLEDAASVSGASRLRAVWYVTVPLMRAGLVSTGLMMFILATREISASVFLYTPQNMTFAVFLYSIWASGTWNRLAAMSLVFALFTLVFVILTRRWITDSAGGD